MSHRVYASAPTAEELERDCLVPKVPALIKGGASAWPAFRKWDWEFLKRELGGDDVLLGDRIGAPQELKKQSVREYVEWIEKSAFCDGPRWYALQYSPFARHPRLREDFPFPAFCRPQVERPDLGWIFFGPEGAKTMPHVDLESTHAWLAQLSGRKRIGLPGGEVVLEPGDLLVIPSDHLHSAVSLEPSITLSFNWVQACKRP